MEMCGSQLKEAEIFLRFRGRFGFTDLKFRVREGGHHHFGVPGTKGFPRMQDFPCHNEESPRQTGIVGHPGTFYQKKLFGSGGFKLHKAKLAKDICKYFLLFLFT